MKTQRTLHAILAGTSCVALLVYVLACGTTSFSPDDRQVLYPSLDITNRCLSLALYDRETGRSQQVLSSVETKFAGGDQSYLHAEWLPDGKHILIAQPGPQNTLSLFVMKPGVKQSLRQISLPNWHQDAPLPTFLHPFAMTREFVFLNEGNLVTRLNWITGEVVAVTNQMNNFTLPDGDSDQSIPYFRVSAITNSPMEFGLMDPQTLMFTPKQTLNFKGFDDAFCEYFDPVTGSIYCISDNHDSALLHVLKGSREIFSRPIIYAGHPNTLIEPRLDLAPDKSRAFAAYISPVSNSTNWEYGLLEIPLNGDHSPQFTPLFHFQSAGQRIERTLFYSARPSLSHDGRTWAVSSAFLALLGNNALRPEDCALYLVDVDGSSPKVTKIPIAMSPNESEDKK